MRYFKIIIIMVLLGSGFSVNAQVKEADRQMLRREEAEMQPLAVRFVNAPELDQRISACKEFIPRLVKALQVNGSFYYPFDSLRQVSILYAPDSSFRVFTWALAEDVGRYRYYGTLQARTPDGSLNMFPFTDASAVIQNKDTITSNKAWIGCIYYKIIKTEKARQAYYTLFGWEGNNFRSNKKLLDVLTFRNDELVFGAPVFNFEKDSVSAGIKNRFILEYKEDGNASISYDEDLQMILYDHLTSVTHEPENKYTLVPDGTYEGFKWKKGSWMHVSKVFDETSDKPPVPKPLEFRKNILEKDTMRAQ